MKKIIFTTIASLITTTAFALNLDVDPNHSSVTFEATHLKISKIPGHFGQFSGSINLDEKDITKSSVDFTVQINSISTNVADRDKHLKSADFFDAEKSPQATFKSTSLKKSGKGFKLEGDLTIRGTTKKVSFDVQNLGKVEDPMMKTTKHVFHATATLNRKDFGVSYGPDAIVGDKVKLMVNLESMAAKTP